VLFFFAFFLFLLVVCAGVLPETTGYTTDLEIDPINKGLVANAELQIRSDVFAAGDVVSYFDPVLGMQNDKSRQDKQSQTTKINQQRNKPSKQQRHRKNKK
jgi:hypothetical protein